MIRIKDPKQSLDFYTRVLGMTLLAKLDFADMQVHWAGLGSAGWAETGLDWVAASSWPPALKALHATNASTSALSNSPMRSSFPPSTHPLY